MKTTSKLTVFTTIACFSVAALLLAADPPAASVPTDAALARLKEGNLRFATSEESKGKPTAARRKETAQTQHPFAIIVACSDSRTGPELVFDQNLGDLFVIRTIASLVRDLQPAVVAAKGKPGDAMHATTTENARQVAAQIKAKAELGDLAKDVQIISAVYDLDTGKVEWTKD